MKMNRLILSLKMVAMATCIDRSKKEGQVNNL